MNTRRTMIVMVTAENINVGCMTELTIHKSLKVREQDSQQSVKSVCSHNTTYTLVPTMCVK